MASNYIEDVHKDTRSRDAQAKIPQKRPERILIWWRVSSGTSAAPSAAVAVASSDPAATAISTSPLLGQHLHRRCFKKNTMSRGAQAKIPQRRPERILIRWRVSSGTSPAPSAAVAIAASDSSAATISPSPLLGRQLHRRCSQRHQKPRCSSEGARSLVLTEF